VENPQLAVGWGDFVAVVDEPDEPESPDDEGDEVAGVDAAGTASALAGDADVSEDDSFLRLSFR
jgi:hypothetical protein